MIDKSRQVNHRGSDDDCGRRLWKIPEDAGTVRHAADAAVVYDWPIPLTNAPDREPVISATEPVHQGQGEAQRNVREPAWSAMDAPIIGRSTARMPLDAPAVNLLSYVCACSSADVPASERTSDANVERARV